MNSYIQSYTYLCIDLLCILIPFIASFYKPSPFYRLWKPFFIANLFVAIPFIIWDIIFTKLGIWGFNPAYLTGYYLFNLPIEEVLFFICIPYACTFTYCAIKYLFPNLTIPRIKYLLSLFFILFSLLLIIIGFNKSYSLVTGLITLSLVSYLLYKNINTNYIYITYLCILPFFLISNGLLTGSFLSEPIVWYNNSENLGLRIGTIPVEDFFYAFSLITLTILIFEKRNIPKIESHYWRSKYSLKWMIFSFLKVKGTSNNPITSVFLAILS